MKLQRNRCIFFASWTGAAIAAAATATVAGEGITAATVTAADFGEKVGASGEYTFTYNGTGWTYRAQLRELLDNDDADAAFEKRNPFSSVGGRFFCAIVTDAIGKMIEAAYAEEAKATAEKTAQYIEEEGNDAGRTAANA